MKAVVTDSDKSFFPISTIKLSFPPLYVYSDRSDYTSRKLWEMVEAGMNMSLINAVANTTRGWRKKVLNNVWTANVRSVLNYAAGG